MHSDHMVHKCHSTIYITSQKLWQLANNTARIILLAASSMRDSKVRSACSQNWLKNRLNFEITFVGFVVKYPIFLHNYPAHRGTYGNTKLIHGCQPYTTQRII